MAEQIAVVKKVKLDRESKIEMMAEEIAGFVSKLKTTKPAFFPSKELAARIMAWVEKNAEV